MDGVSTPEPPSRKRQYLDDAQLNGADKGEESANSRVGRGTCDWRAGRFLQMHVFLGSEVTLKLAMSRIQNLVGSIKRSEHYTGKIT
ncbi:hypothetical protein EOPP23_14215 [Endozoicomonas sp. OPT23]|nr:hypothetical protein [Endozoicomonas sp. OPT23]